MFVFVCFNYIYVTISVKEVLKNLRSGETQWRNRRDNICEKDLYEILKKAANKIFIKLFQQKMTFIVKSFS